MLNYFYFICTFILGLIFGSFLNVLLWRSWENLSIFKSRSICVNCRRQLKWYDNIPILSFIFLKGRCRYCQKAIHWQYPAVELTIGLLFLFIAFWHYNAQSEVFITPKMIRDFFIVFFLVFIFVYDLLHKEILDRITLAPALILYLISIAMRWSEWHNMVFGILIGGGFFLIQYLISRGKWVGGGDIRLGILIGVILGWPNILFALSVAYILGAIVSVFLLALKKKKLADATPFGTYLTLATFIAMFWGEGIIKWYLGLIG